MKIELSTKEKIACTMGIAAERERCARLVEAVAEHLETNSSEDAQSEQILLSLGKLFRLLAGAIRRDPDQRK